jgi:hypothetical protein
MTCHRPEVGTSGRGPSRYLLEAMGALEKDKVVFEIKDAQSPGVIKSVEDEGYCCVTAVIGGLRAYVCF